MEQLILPGCEMYARSGKAQSNSERELEVLRFSNERLQYALPGLETDLAAIRKMKEVSEHTMQLRFSYGRALF